MLFARFRMYAGARCRWDIASHSLGEPALNCRRCIEPHAALADGQCGAVQPAQRSAATLIDFCAPAVWALYSLVNFTLFTV